MPAGGSVRAGRLRRRRLYRRRLHRRRLHRRGPAVAVSLLAVLVSACATLPGNSSVQKVQVANDAGAPNQANLQMIPVAPQASWYAPEVLNGFLASLASYDSDPQAVRAYLAGPGAQTWRPKSGVVILDQPPESQQSKPPNSNSLSQQNAQIVTASGTEVASLTPNGQYQANQPGKSVSYTFNMVNLGPDVGWRVEVTPQSQKPLAIPLIITQNDFDSLYTPRNLYFMSSGGHSLLPDPVLVPVQATSVDLAHQLLSALRSTPSGWLATAVSTAFPPDAAAPQVTISSGIATVTLSGAAATARPAALQRMLAQAYWTLTSQSYSQQPIVPAVQLEVNGRVVASACCGRGTIAGYTVPRTQPGLPLFSIGSHGIINELNGPRDAPSLTQAPGWAGQPGPAISRIAISPDGRYIAALSQSGAAVYYGSLQDKARLTRWSAGGKYTSISWDNQDNLWVAGPPQQVWQLQPTGTATAVILQHLALNQATMSQFQIAPDGVRYAMIVTPPGGSAELQIGALTYSYGEVAAPQPPLTLGAGIITDPRSVSWYDADDLLVMSGSRANPQLWEVPVDNDVTSANALVAAPGVQSLSGAGAGNPVVEGLSDGRLALTSTNGGETIVKSNIGLDPTYPG